MKNQYKALICDFDNTLAGADHTIPEEVMTALRALTARGVIVTIATGRFYYGVIRHIAHELALGVPLITSGGAELVDPVTEKVLWGSYLGYATAEKVFKLLNSKDWFYVLEAGELLYTSHDKDIHRFDRYAEYKPLSSFKNDERINKIVVPSGINDMTEDEAEALEDILKNDFPELHVTRTVYGKKISGFDITAANATKHMGVLQFVKHMGIEREECVGVGDGYNDFPLLTACGIGVAMADAPPELRGIADYIAPPQSENGVLEVIKRYF